MGFAPQFSARIESSEGVGRIALIGELDLATVPFLEETLARLGADGALSITLDLRDLTFLDCSAIRAFLDARDRATAGGHLLILAGASPRARRLFELTHTEFLLDDQDSDGLTAHPTGAATLRAGLATIAQAATHV
jgi:anti-sigma B factor antagonist